MVAKIKRSWLTLAMGTTRKAPPPPDSTMTARNFGLTAQKVESQLPFDIRMLSKHCAIMGDDAVVIRVKETLVTLTYTESLNT